MAEENGTLALHIVPHANVGPSSAQKPVTQRKDKDVKIPRPPNAWIIFRAEVYKNLTEEGSMENMSQSAVSKVISKMWNSLTPESRQQYERLAEVRKMEHALKYPDYRYAPKTKEQKEREKKKQKLDKAAAAAATRNHRRRHALEAPGTSPVNAIPYPLAASTPAQSVSSNSVDGPTPPLSANNSPSPTTSQEDSEQNRVTLTYPSVQMAPTAYPASSAGASRSDLHDDRRATSRRSRQPAPYTRPVVPQRARLEPVIYSTLKPIVPTYSVENTAGDYPQDAYTFDVNPIVSQDATNWAIGYDYQLAAHPPSNELYQPSGALALQHSEAGNPFQMSMGAHMNDYSSWATGVDQPLDYQWKPFSQDGMANDPNAMTYTLPPSAHPSYDGAGFFLEPEIAGPSNVTVQQSSVQPSGEDEVQAWFDFNGFSDLAPADGDLQNVDGTIPQTTQIGTPTWNGYSYHESN